jgi:hypothetical protein
LDAYYGGALTMFFSSEVKVPFQGIRDVIRSYPEWILMIQAGDIKLLKCQIIMASSRKEIDVAFLYQYLILPIQFERFNEK